MKLKNQVCSLEMAIKLKELGVKQKSLWYWVKHYNNSIETFIWGLFQKDEDDKVNEHISAFTVAKLGEMLSGNEMNEIDIKFYNFAGVWYCDYSIGKLLDKGTCDKSEANARAKMLIYLIEKGFLKRGEL